MRILLAFEHEPQAAAVLGLENAGVVSENLIVLSNLFARLIEMEPQIQDEVVIASGLLQELLEKAPADHGLISICRSVNGYDRVYVLKCKSGNVFNGKIVHVHVFHSSYLCASSVSPGQELKLP